MIRKSLVYRKFTTGINNDDSTETSMEILDKIVFYLSSLSPPKRRNVQNIDILRGKEIFYKSNCTSCHNPKYVTSKNAKFDFLKYHRCNSRYLWQMDLTFLHHQCK